jgi:hypothetical protein
MLHRIRLGYEKTYELSEYGARGVFRYLTPHVEEWCEENEVDLHSIEDNDDDTYTFNFVDKDSAALFRFKWL